MRRTSLLLKTYLRRDWFKFVVWALCIVGLAAVAAGKFNSLYETEAAMASIIATLKTPAMVSMFGPMTATAPYTVAVIYAMEMMVFMGFFMAMMNIYFAVKNTRGEEDSGVLELTRARAVSRNAPLTAVISQLVIINVVMGVLLTLGLEVSGMNGVTIEGSLLFGISLAIFGMMFGSFSLLIAQLTDNSRGATIGSYVLLGGLFVLRMITDVQNSDTTWWTIYG
jgi:ABC-2 type transport system permease protein